MSIGRGLLWMLLLLTVVAALWPVPEENTAEDAASRPRVARKPLRGGDTYPAQQLRALTTATPARTREIIDLFPRQSFVPPATDPAPAQPTAPALPFTYGGRYTEGRNVYVFLKEGGSMHTVQLGDIVNATYRIESIAPEAITLTYLPLGLEQTLQTGSTTSP